MFCDNVSYHTDRQQNCLKNCSPKAYNRPAQSFQYIPTEQSERNPSNLYKNIISGRTHQGPEINQPNVNFLQPNTAQLINQNTRREVKKIQALQRNQNLSAILSIVLAFSQRIQTLKEKLCGYPAQNFSPAQFFNVLDLSEKGYVDFYDVKRFVNNDKIREKDVISLFKRVNGDHSKDNSKLSYFGYLNLIKPYFNQQLARDLLLRDTATKKSKKVNQSPESKVSGQLIEPTQQSVLLLFQQLILLHCICTSEHEQAKQLLMNEYMLNTLQIKQIVGLGSLEDDTIKSTVPKEGASRIRHKSCLSVFYEFVEKNSQFEIELKEMKHLLSFLNCHQFSLTTDKYLSLLFLPTNCKTQILKELDRQKEELMEAQQANNYMNTYLTKQNLMNRGNIQPIREYLGRRADYQLTGQHLKIMASNLGGTAKANFLQFVHPRSLNRANLIPQQDQNILYQQYPTQQLPSPHLSNQHPEFLINASNKHLSQNKSANYNPLQASSAQKPYSNSSSIPQQNIKVIPPRNTLTKQDYESNRSQLKNLPMSYNTQFQKRNHEVQQGLSNQFYQSQKYKDQDVNISKVSNTPFLQQFMNRDNVLKKYQKDPQKRQFKKTINQESSQVQSSGYSDSAFQVINYGYQESKINHYRGDDSKRPDKSQKKQTLESRYNMVVSQYKGNNLPNKANDTSSYSKNPNNIRESSGPKFEKSRNPVTYHNNLLNTSKSNYVDSVGLSQSNMVNDSNLLNKFSTGGGNILQQFFKK